MFNQSINQSSLLSYVRHGCPVARARGSCLKRKTIKLSMSKTISNILKIYQEQNNKCGNRIKLKYKNYLKYYDRIRITCTIRKQIEMKLYTRVKMTAVP